jgi:hypothetical protein
VKVFSALMETDDLRRREISETSEKYLGTIMSSLNMRMSLKNHLKRIKPGEGIQVPNEEELSEYQISF